MSARAGSKRIAAISVAIVTSIAFACSSDSTQPDNPSGPKFSAPLPIEAGATIGAATYASGDSSTGGQGAPVDGIACDTTKLAIIAMPTTNTTPPMMPAMIRCLAWNCAASRS